MTHTNENNNELCNDAVLRAEALLADVKTARATLAEKTDPMISKIDQGLADEEVLLDKTEKELTEESARVADAIDRAILTFVADDTENIG